MSREKIYHECPACGTDITNTTMANHIHGDCPVLSDHDGGSGPESEPHKTEVENP